MASLVTYPGQYNFPIYIGSTLSQVLTWNVNGSPVNLSGYSAAMAIVSTTGTSIITLSTGAGTIVLGGSAGTITLTLSATQTQALPYPSTGANYDLILTSGSGVVTPLVAGQVYIQYGPTLGS